MGLFCCGDACNYCFPFPEMKTVKCHYSVSLANSAVNNILLKTVLGQSFKPSFLRVVADFFVHSP